MAAIIPKDLFRTILTWVREGFGGVNLSPACQRGKKKLAVEKKLQPVWDSRRKKEKESYDLQIGFFLLKELGQII